MKINYQNGVLTSNDGKDKNAEIKVKGGVFYSIAKRTFDIVSSFLMLVVFSPLILILLLVKFLEDGKNPVYTSVRVGKGGKRFKFHKIRSMVVFKMKDDPRITKFGRFLRRSSLDEILQLWDILIGNLSVVGPRSPLPKEVEKYTPYEMHRLDVKGGLLCLWQIQPNRHSIKFDEWVKLDIEYIENRSIWLDLKIIFKGAVMVIFDHSGD